MPKRLTPAQWGIVAALLAAGSLTLPSSAQTVDLSNPAVPFSSADANLLVRDSEVRVNGKTLFRVGGTAGGHVIWFFSPRYGRFIFSTKQHPKYYFDRVQVLDGRRIVFDSGGDHFEWIMKEPLVETGEIHQLWMMHDRLPEPIREPSEPGGIVGSASHYEYLFTAEAARRMRFNAWEGAHTR